MIRYDKDKESGETLLVTLRIAIKNPLTFPFRLIGDKANGVFVTCVSDDTCLLKNGDILLSCNELKLRGLSCNQVLCAMKYFLNQNNGFSCIKLWRNNDCFFQNKIRRHWTVNEGMNLINTQFVIENDILNKIDTRTSSNGPICTLVIKNKEISDANDIKIPNNTKNYMAIFDEAKQKTTTRMEPKKQYLNDIVKKTHNPHQNLWICPTCKYPVRMRRLHSMKHEWISNAKRLFPRSTSNFFELQHFDDEEIEEDNLFHETSFQDYSCLI